ncbi:MAG: lipid-A-disaccharide synthase, partial [Gemmatimonadaceae bacterium]
ILPFEERLLQEAGIDTTFVGHPLLDRAQELPDRAEARRRLGLPADREVLALFPGSRAQEIERHLQAFEAVARELQRRRPGLEVVVSVAPTIQLDASHVPFPMVRAQSFDVLRAADVALCKSGTTTLEAAV